MFCQFLKHVFATRLFGLARVNYTKPKGGVSTNKDSIVTRSPKLTTSNVPPSRVVSTVVVV